jgi:hypothetical protein
VPLIRVDEQWEEWCSDDEPPPPDAFAALVIEQRLIWYALQQPHLQQWVGEDVHVAEAIATEADGGISMSATLVEGVPTLLPQVDVVVLVPKHAAARGSSDGSLLVEWDELVHRMGARMEPTTDFPPRWMVHGRSD